MVNSPKEMLPVIALFSVIGGALHFSGQLTVQRAGELAAGNPLLAAGFGLSILFFVLFGKPGSGSDHGP